MERQLQVLNRIEERLAQIEARLSPPVQPITKNDRLVEGRGAGSSLVENGAGPQVLDTENEEPLFGNGDAISAGAVERWSLPKKK